MVDLNLITHFVLVDLFIIHNLFFLYCLPNFLLYVMQNKTILIWSANFESDDDLQAECSHRHPVVDQDLIPLV